VDYVKGLDAASGQVAVAGFCWGGAQTFRFVTVRDDLAAGFVFYGSALEDEAAYAEVKAPVYGFYGGNDARITAAVPDVEEKMAAAGKDFQQRTYEGAGHGFMRSGEAAEPGTPNRDARDQAWEHWKTILEGLGN